MGRIVIPLTGRPFKKQEQAPSVYSGTEQDSTWLRQAAAAAALAKTVAGRGGLVDEIAVPVVRGIGNLFDGSGGSSGGGGSAGQPTVIPPPNAAQTGVIPQQATPPTVIPAEGGQSNLGGSSENAPPQQAQTAVAPPSPYGSQNAASQQVQMQGAAPAEAFAGAPSTDWMARRQEDQRRRLLMEQAQREQTPPGRGEMPPLTSVVEPGGYEDAPAAPAPAPFGADVAPEQVSPGEIANEQAMLRFRLDRIVDDPTRREEADAILARWWELESIKKGGQQNIASQYADARGPRDQQGNAPGGPQEAAAPQQPQIVPEGPPQDYVPQQQAAQAPQTSFGQAMERQSPTRAPQQQAPAQVPQAQAPQQAAAPQAQAPAAAAPSTGSRRYDDLYGKAMQAATSGNAQDLQAVIAAYGDGEGVDNIPYTSWADRFSGDYKRQGLMAMLSAAKQAAALAPKQEKAPDPRLPLQMAKLMEEIEKLRDEGPKRRADARVAAGTVEERISQSELKTMSQRQQLLLGELEGAKRAGQITDLELRNGITEIRLGTEASMRRAELMVARNRAYELGSRGALNQERTISERTNRPYRQDLMYQQAGAASRSPAAAYGFGSSQTEQRNIHKELRGARKELELALAQAGIRDPNIFVDMRKSGPAGATARARWIAVTKTDAGAKAKALKETVDRLAGEAQTAPPESSSSGQSGYGSGYGPGAVAPPRPAGGEE